MNAKKSPTKPANIRAKLKFPSVEKFIERYAPNISRAGIFVKTPQPRSVGTPIRFEFLISDGTPVMRGIGEVAWIRETAEGDKPPGMGVKFAKLDSKSREILSRVIEWKEHQAPERDVLSRYSDSPPVPPLPEAEPEEPEPEEPEPEEEPEKKAKPKHRARAGRARRAAAKVDLGAIDSMLADIAAPAKPSKRRRSKRRRAPAELEEPAAPEPQVAEEAPEPEPEAEVSPELEAEEPEPRAEVSPELEAGEPEPEEIEPEELEPEELEPEVSPEVAEPELDDILEGEDYLADGGSDAIGRLIDDEIGDEIFETEDQAPITSLSEPDSDLGLAAAPGDDALQEQPQPTISFMPETTANGTAELDAQLESVLDEPLEDQGELELDDDLEAIDTEAILGVDDDAPEIALEEIDDAEMEEILSVDDDDLAVEVADPVGSLVDEMTRDSAQPPPPQPLLGGEDVTEALEDFFSQATTRNSAPLPQGSTGQPPDTLPDDAIPPGLVRERRQRSAISPADAEQPTEQADEAAIAALEGEPADDEEDDKKKKGFFKRLFSKKE